MKFVERHPFTDADAVAQKLVEIANGVEAVQDGRIYIERVNEPFLAAGGSGEQFRAGIARAVALGWLWRHESGTYVKFTDSGAAPSGTAPRVQHRIPPRRQHTLCQCEGYVVAVAPAGAAHRPRHAD